MDAELKKKWVDALRSGDYKQTVDYLYKEEEGAYCALGLVGHLAGLNYVRISPSSEVCVPDLPEGQRGYEWWNEQNIPTSTIIDLNDWKKKTFPEIADWIEENVK